MDIPPAARKAASLRLMLFDRWVAQIADEHIPVTYVDSEKFMEVLKNSHSYKVRAKAGYTLNTKNWEYTWKELQVDSGLLIAIIDGNPYLTGKEFNQYVRTNYNGIRYFAKRAKSLDTLRSIIAKTIVSGKIAMVDTVKIETELVEKAINDYISRRMFDMQLDIRNCSAQTISGYMNEMVQKYHDANADKITDFKNLLQGNRQSNPGDYLCTVLMMNCKVTALQKKITDTIEKKEIYNWMEANDFKGSRDEAIRRVVSDRYEKYIDEQIGKKKIDITL